MNLATIFTGGSHSRSIQPTGQNGTTHPGLGQPNCDGSNVNLAPRPTEGCSEPVSPSIGGRVLIVEDGEPERALLGAALKVLNCQTEIVGDGRAALISLETHPPDLVVLDLLLPHVNGYEIIQHMRASTTLSRVPILVVSVVSHVQELVRALELGADDFIMKGFDPTEFRVRVWRLLTQKHRMDRLNQKCEQAMHRAATDSLTGLHNRAFLEEMLEHELNFVRRHGNAASLVFSDIDGFKKLNDRYGHTYGDQVLRCMAWAIQDTVRSSDTVSRLGGDELVILLPRTGRCEATKLAERIRVRVESLSIGQELTDQHAPITISMGIATCPDDANDAHDLLRCSDQALYAAKRAGGNCLRTFDQVGGGFGSQSSVVLSH